MSIATDKARLDAAKADLKAFLVDNGVTVPDGTKIDGMVEMLGDIKTGGGTDTKDYEVETYYSYADSVPAAKFKDCKKLYDASFYYATSVGNYAFQNCTELGWMPSLPEAVSIGNYAFSGCSSMSDITLPNATHIGNYAFSGCSYVSSVDLTEAVSIGNYAFSGCDGFANKTIIEFPKVTSVGEYIFDVQPFDFGALDFHLDVVFAPNALFEQSDSFIQQFSVEHIALRSMNVCNSFVDMYDYRRQAWIYVPAAILSQYAAAFYRKDDRYHETLELRALENYTEDGTITGKLDPNKMWG